MRYRLAGGVTNSLGSTGDFFPLHGRSQSSNNMNDWTSPGVYTQFNPTNSPVANWIVCLVVCLDTNPSFTQQLCFSRDAMYFRSANDSNWGDWHKIV